MPCFYDVDMLTASLDVPDGGRFIDSLAVRI